jgi:hypothetical protein
MTEKFKVGDKVYDIQFGFGWVDEYRGTDTCLYPIEVSFPLLTGDVRTYTPCGRLGKIHANPTLLTLAEARSKGYDVLKEKVKKAQVKYYLVFASGEFGSDRFMSKTAAEFAARLSYDQVTGVGKVTYEWEEEI